MTPLDWAKRPLLKYADFTGRASRPEYWWYVLANLVVMILAMAVESMLGINGMVFGVYGPLTALLGVGLITPSLAVAVRRLHDTNRSGWWVLLAFVPLVGLFLIYLLALESVAHENMYGPLPEADPQGAL